MKSCSFFCPALQNFSSHVKTKLNPEKIVAVHLRFGDIYKKSSQNAIEHETVAKNMIQWALKIFPDKSCTFLIMCDRKDYPAIFDSIKQAGFRLLFTDELIDSTNIQKNQNLLQNVKNPQVAQFCIQKLMCEQCQWFIANYGSTVSVSLAYNMWLQGKDWELFSNVGCSSYNPITLKLNVNTKEKSEKYSWKQRGATQGHTTSWAYFSPDTIVK